MKNKIILYRTVFTIRPLQVITIIYKIKSTNFKFFIYNAQKSETYLKKYSTKYLLNFVPYLNNMLKLRLYKELGLRLIKTLKNSLIVFAFMESINNDEFKN